MLLPYGAPLCVIKRLMRVKKLCNRAYLGLRNSSRRYGSSGSAASQQSAAQSAAEAAAAAAAATGSSETITTQVRQKQQH